MLDITEAPIDASSILRGQAAPEDGALATFFGIVRKDSNVIDQVSGLIYEAYIPMALKVFKDIELTAKSRWNITNLSILHRIGTLSIGEIAVAITVSAKHRKEALAACAFAIDAVKSEAPIWKKEIHSCSVI